MVETSDPAGYGWGTAEPCFCCDYVGPAVLRLLRESGLGRTGRVLDLGCGNGAFAGRLAALGHDVVGCDADPGGIAIARAAHPSVRYEVLGVEDDPAPLLAPGGAFDAVVATEVIEHLPRPQSLVRFAAAVLKPGGTLVLSTPYHGWLKNVLIAATGHWDDHHMVGNDHGHVKFFSRRTLTEAVESQGLAVTAFAGAGRLPYLWKSMLLAARKP